MRGCRCQAPARLRGPCGAVKSPVARMPGLGWRSNAARRRSCHAGPYPIEGLGTSGAGHATENIAQSRSWNAACLAASDRHGGNNSRQNKVGPRQRATHRKIDSPAAAGNTGDEAWVRLRDGVSPLRPPRIDQPVIESNARRAGGSPFAFLIEPTQRAPRVALRNDIRYVSRDRAWVKRDEGKDDAARLSARGGRHAYFGAARGAHCSTRAPFCLG